MCHLIVLHLNRYTIVYTFCYFFFSLLHHVHAVGHPAIRSRYARKKHPAIRSKYARKKHPAIRSRYARKKHPAIRSRYARKKHPTIRSRSNKRRRVRTGSQSARFTTLRDVKWSEGDLINGIGCTASLNVFSLNTQL